MLKIALVFTLVGFSLPSFSQNAFGHISVAAQFEALALPGSLHDTMKAMSRALKSIEVDEPSKSAANAQAADLFSNLALHAKSFTPDEIADMPAADRPAAMARYREMLDQAAALGRSLAEAFRKGDSAKANQLLQQLDAAKKQGHGEFK